MSNVGRPKNQPDREPTGERLLAAATAEFGQRGFDAARLEDIAAAAGIRRASLLYHFDSKEALYEAVIREAFLALDVLLRASIEDESDFRVRIAHMIDRTVRFFEQRPYVAALITRELIDVDGPGRALLREYGVPLLDAMDGWIREAGGAQLRPGVDVRGVILTIVSAAVLRPAAGTLRDPLWGTRDSAVELGLSLFFKDG